MFDLIFNQDQACHTFQVKINQFLLEMFQIYKDQSYLALHGSTLQTGLMDRFDFYSRLPETIFKYM